MSINSNLIEENMNIGNSLYLLLQNRFKDKTNYRYIKVNPQAPMILL